MSNLIKEEIQYMDKINPKMIRHQRPVEQYSKNGELIKIWDSIIDVERQLYIPSCNVIYACKGKRKTAGGYIWRYKQ